MDDIYLIEIRLGRTKWRIRETVISIATTTGITPFMERHPHLTLFGPLELLPTTTPQQVLDTIESIASRYDPVPFTIDRFEKREGMHGSVIAFTVHPSESLKQLTAAIATALFPITKSHNTWDGHPEQKWYHVTVANHLNQKKAAKVFSSLLEAEKPDAVNAPKSGFCHSFLSRLLSWLHLRPCYLPGPVLLDEAGLRITVMHGEEIFAEYDLLEKCWITESHRHDSPRGQETLARFRQHAGFELTEPQPADPGDILLIADLHLGHANIIRYCSRPFRVNDTTGMDRVLVGNWNACCTKNTKIFHIGDLSYGTGARPAQEYRDELMGDAEFIAGNHDRADPGSLPFTVIEHEGMRFYLVHDPMDAPKDFDGWVIHGHHHNNDLRQYPFIDFIRRRINVSAEVTGYVPASLSDICQLIRDRAKSGDMEPILLRYPYPW